MIKLWRKIWRIKELIKEVDDKSFSHYIPYDTLNDFFHNIKEVVNK